MDERDYKAMNKIKEDEILISFKSKGELKLHIQTHMPIAVKPTRKAKTVFVDPFTSASARDICIDAIVDSFFK